MRQSMKGWALPPENFTGNPSLGTLSQATRPGKLSRPQPLLRICTYAYIHIRYVRIYADGGVCTHWYIYA